MASRCILGRSPNIGVKLDPDWKQMVLQVKSVWAEKGEAFKWGASLNFVFERVTSALVPKTL